MMVNIKLKLFLIASAALAGCQSPPGDQQPLILTQTPPAVQSAFMSVYPGVTIQQIIRQPHSGQDYYTFTYTGSDGDKHEVQLNEAGDQVDKH